ncbi:13387_t:CDS:2 [Ambispora leptoticha]|uniref:13387_t:CDS:1 n=1 Tax=Ambispora leptoticha TaxID=144679 RepID=A0A9N9C298_9GLOM|nr:13387_t:CDS:2 [Ambispora leptoticha]
MLSYRLPELSSDSLDLSVINDPYDTLIEIHDRTSGDIKDFNAHSSVLRRRCEYFKVALSEKWTRKIDDKYKLRLDGSSDAFEIILKGICSGTIILKNLNTDILMELMLASDILLLHEFFDLLRSKLNEKRDINKNWCDEDIISILRTSYRIASAQDLYLLCQDIVAERPLILFESPTFPSIDEEILLSILKLDAIYLPEIIIFNKLIEWGIANTPDFDTLTDNTSQINALGVTLEKGLPLIRYVNLSNEEELTILKFEQILPEVRYQLPRRINSPIEPRIISSRFAGLIATWIDRKNPIEAPYTASNNPFQFRLVFRMDDQTTFYQEHHKYYNKSSDRSLPTMKCHHGPSLMIMKLKSSGKIIGAYNPIDWKQDLPKNVYLCTSESFLFSSEDMYGTNHRLSRVRDFDHAICLEGVNPSGVLLKFGEDLIISKKYSFSNVSCYVKNGFYEQPTIMDEGSYEIEQWEIYRVSRKDGQPMMVIDEVKHQVPPRINPLEIRIIDSEFVGLIATWIDREDPMKAQYTGSNIPFQFTLLFRMNDNTTFYEEHNKYYNQSTGRLLPTMKCHHGPSLMIMKLKNSGKIIGAYNPINWKQRSSDDEYVYTKDSFIFSSEDIHGSNHRLSRVMKDFYHAIGANKITSRSHYSDIEVLKGILLSFGGLGFVYDEGRRTDPCVICRVRHDESYEQPTIIAEGDYKIDEWEIFRVTRKDNFVPSQLYSPIEPKIINSRKNSVVPFRIDSPFVGSTELINNSFARLIAKWIDGVDDSYTNFDMPFQFTLLFRKGNDRTLYSKYYNQSTYRELPTMKCHHGPSLMIMRVKNSGKIIGAYNPINWKRDLTNCKNKYVHTSESFIFSSEDRSGTNPQLSRVKNFDKAMSQVNIYPNGMLLKFGEDLGFIYDHGNLHTDEPDYGMEDDVRFPRVFCYVKENGFYEQPAILPKGNYEIDQWEVFRVIRTDNQ